MTNYLRRSKILKRFGKRRLLLIAGITIILLVTIVFLAIIKPSQSRTSGDVAAIVDGQVITISELNAEVDYKKIFYAANKQEVNGATLRNDTLETLIDAQLIQEYANKNNIYIADQEAQNAYNARVAQFDDEQELLTEITRLYGLDKKSFQDKLSYDLLREKVQTSVGTSLQEWLDQQRKTADIERFI